MGAAAGASAKAWLKSVCRMAQSIKLSYIGTGPVELADESSKSNTFFEDLKAMAKTATRQLVVCVNNDGYPASLEKRKIYVALRDAKADGHGLLRIIDESGDDYLYPKALFRSIALPEAVKKAVLNAA
jgi:hypothetical protein